MPLRKMEAIKEIEEKLAVISARVKLANANHHYDIDTAMEDFCTGLLNRTFEWNLKNVNYEKMNTPAIDLGDETNKISVQVTSQKDGEKVRNTLFKFVQNGYQKKYDRLIIFILVDKQGSYSYDENKYADFFSKDDIWNFEDYMREVSKLDTDKVEKIKEYVFHEFPYSDLNTWSSYEQWRNILKKLDENKEDEVYLDAKTIFPEELLKIYEKLRGAKREYQKCKEYLNCLIDIVYSGMEPEEKIEADSLEREGDIYGDYSRYDEFMSGYTAIIDVPYLEKHSINYADICGKMRIYNMQEQKLRAELKEKIIEFMRKKALSL